MTTITRPPLAERLSRALQDGLSAERGETTLRSRIVTLPQPPPEFDAERILRIRERRNLSRAGLATLLDVSGKTVENWERGIRKPTGPAARFLQLLEAPEAFRGCLDDVVDEARSSDDEVSAARLRTAFTPPPAAPDSPNARWGRRR
jgi:DNA-binding transcriptional regulator YiaG